MPQWGRPSGERSGGSSSSRRRKEWERQQKEWESQRRFEELDSDFDDEDDGVNLAYGQEFSVSEPSDSDGEDYEPGSDMQLVLRGKEDVLVSRAMARIRRAQELGKDNVKLTPAESEALERKMAKDRAKGRRPIVEKIPPKKGRQSLPAPTTKKKASRASLPQQDDLYNDRPARVGSRQNLQQTQLARRRPVPEDPNWRPRSSSSAQPLPYPTFAHEQYNYPPPGYRPGSSRHVSGPAELDYHHLAPYQASLPNSRAYGSSSDPALNRRSIASVSAASRRREQDSESDEDEDDDDADQGVQVDVIPSNATAQGYEVVSRPAPTGRASQSASLGRKRGGRR